jgi:FtsH-binding integral membrane protein
MTFEQGQIIIMLLTGIWIACLAMIWIACLAIHYQLVNLRKELK